MLIDRGFKPVRPLAGGLEAWIAAGLPVEMEQLIRIGESGSMPRPEPSGP
jgi:3-mercaptopyruvate sulfurtransferase SseA